MAQDRLRGEKRVKFAGHEGGEAFALPSSSLDPLGVRARHAAHDVHGSIAIKDAPSKLGFLAAHDVGRCRICASPGMIRTSRAMSPIFTAPERWLSDRAGTGDIVRLDPALPRTGHSANDNRQSAAAPSAARWPSSVSAKPSSARCYQAIIGALLGQNMPLGVDKPEAKTACSPIDCGIDRCRCSQVATVDNQCLGAKHAGSIGGEEQARSDHVLRAAFPRAAPACEMCAGRPSSVTQCERWRSVITQPGAMALTRIFSGPSLPANPLVRPMIPALAAV